MPHIVLNLYPGRTEETLRSMAERVRATFVTELGFQAEEVSVAVMELPPETFAEEVGRRYAGERLILPSRFIHASGPNGQT